MIRIGNIDDQSPWATAHTDHDLREPGDVRIVYHETAREALAYLAAFIHVDEPELRCFALFIDDALEHFMEHDAQAFVAAAMAIRDREAHTYWGGWEVVSTPGGGTYLASTECQAVEQE